MIVIVDYGVGNLGSIRNMLRKCGAKEVKISSVKEDIASASKLILPGVGSFDYGMGMLHQYDFVDLLNKRVLLEKIPILGICLGAQLLGRGSEEGKTEGLGWINAYSRKFVFDDSKLKVPHMGWSYVRAAKSSKLLEGIDVKSRFYFVHSYHIVCDNAEEVLLQSEYGFQFTAAVETTNIMGVQFHPEKSHKYGMKLLGNFINNY